MTLQKCASLSGVGGACSLTVEKMKKSAPVLVVMGDEVSRVCLV